VSGAHKRCSTAALRLTLRGLRSQATAASKREWKECVTEAVVELVGLSACSSVPAHAPEPPSLRPCDYGATGIIALGFAQESPSRGPILHLGGDKHCGKKQQSEVVERLRYLRNNQVSASSKSSTKSLTIFYKARSDLVLTSITSIVALSDIANTEPAERVTVLEKKSVMAS